MAEPTASLDSSDDASATPSGPLPEFRIVVKHPDRRGPLAPFRLLIVVAVVAVAVGPALWGSITGGNPDDGVLVRAALIGLLVWVTTGIVSAALGSAETRPSRTDLVDRP